MFRTVRDRCHTLRWRYRPHQELHKTLSLPERLHQSGLTWWEVVWWLWFDYLHRVWKGDGESMNSMLQRPQLILTESLSSNQKREWDVARGIPCHWRNDFRCSSSSVAGQGTEHRSLLTMHVTFLATGGMASAAVQAVQLVRAQNTAHLNRHPCWAWTRLRL
jgi:hypothetical protein